MEIRVRFASAVAAAVAVLATVLGTMLGTPGSAPAATATHYRVSAGVRPSTVLVGHRVTVTGTVRPLAAGQAVKVQLAVDGGWHTVAVARLGARSRFVATYAPPGVGAYQLRVRKPPAEGHRRGTSATLTVTVSPSLPPT